MTPLEGIITFFGTIAIIGLALYCARQSVKNDEEKKRKDGISV